MYCSKCGKKNNDADLFCAGCGNSLKANSITGNVPNGIATVQDELQNLNGKKQKLAPIVIFVIAIVAFICIFGLNSPDYTEYTNNSGDKLPIVVKGISKQVQFNDNVDLTIDIENTTYTDYRKAGLAVLAWDSDGLPIELCGLYEFESSYLNYWRVDNVAAKTKYTYTTTLEPADIKYISVFVDNCVDFDGNAWENPLSDDISNYQGKKIEDVDMCYFKFD